MAETVSLVQKKIIHSILYGNYDIINIYYGRIYTCGKDSKFWLYSGLEGALVYCIEVRIKVLRFLLFDLKTYEIVFDCELYKKFNKSFTKGTETFYYFGVNDGFIGFEIPDQNEAAILEEEICNNNGNSNSDDIVKTRLKEYKPMKENDIKERGRQMIQLLKKRFQSTGNKSIKSEIIINQGELENSINTIDVDDQNGRLILTGSGYKGIDKELKKVRGLRLEQNQNIGDNEIFSKYIARNILASLMKGIVVPKRKIDRQIWAEGEEVVQEPQEEEEEQPKPEKKEKKKEKSPKKEKTPKKKKEKTPKKKKEKTPKKKKEKSPKKANKSPDKIEVVAGSGKGVPPPPPPPPPPPSIK